MDQRINLHKLHVFCRVVELGSVTRAGEELWLAQPVVSGHLKWLQDRVGARLVFWEGRDLQLTEVGRTFYHWARRVVDGGEEISRLISASKRGISGRMVIGTSTTPGTYLVPPLLLVAHDLFPDMELAIEIFETNRVESALIEGRADVALLVHLHSQLNRQQVEWTQLRSEELVLVAAPSRGDISGDLREVAALPFVCAPRGHVRRQGVDWLLQSHGIERRNVLLELGHPESIRAAVLQDAGVAIMFRHAVEADLRSGRLRQIDLDCGPLTVPLLAGRPLGRILSEHQQQIFKFFVEELSDELRPALRLREGYDAALSPRVPRAGA
jgi:LysR family transcriptional regulator, low CO2-responsive transcriptional regulator